MRNANSGMSILRILLCSAAISLGTFMFVYGGWDDSPGAQLLGVLLAIGSVVVLIRSRNR